MNVFGHLLRFRIFRVPQQVPEMGPAPWQAKKACLL